MSEPLTLERRGAVARLRIAAPETRNAFTVAMWQRLSRLVAEAESDEALRVLTVESADPRLFCSGADLGEFARMLDDKELRRTNRDAMLGALNALAALRLPTVAVVGGPCMGAGLALAVACDLRIAGASARFGLPPARLGLVYSLSDTARLIDLIGPAQVKKLVYTAQPTTADEARLLGLVDSVVAPEVLDEEAETLTAAIAANSPITAQAMKDFVTRALAGSRAETEASLARFFDVFDAGDFAEGIAAFSEKRKPRF